MKAGRGDANREIEAVENIIRVLNRCLWMHWNNKEFGEARRCFNDIQKCKRELKKIKRQAAENAHNGKGDMAEDAANK